MNPWQITRSVRGLNRLRQIAQVLSQEGFGHIVDQMQLRRFVPVWVRRGARAEPPAEGTSALGKRLARVCSRLGPTFVKFGQVLTARPDIVPEPVLAELRTLQDDVPPFDTAEARRTIEADLGRTVEDCFESFGDEPIASGSIGQVYRARLRGEGGGEVVVKVRRPGIEQVIELDMMLLKWLATSLESFVPEVRPFRPVMIVAEYEEILAREMDYIHEASNTARFGEAFRDRPEIRIPPVHWNLCSPRVLTLGVVPGRNVEAVLRAGGDARENLDGALLARRLVEAYLDQIFEIGLFQADPHPGNILVEPPANISLIDFGQVGIISDEAMTQLIVILYAGIGRQVDLIGAALGDLRALGPDTDRRELERSLQSLIDKYYALPLKRFDVGTMLTEFAEVIRRHDVAIPREIMALVKALGLATNVAQQLDPNLDVLALLRPRIRGLVRARLSPRHLTRAAAVSGWHLLSVIRQLPGGLREGLRRLSEGRWQLKILHENIDRLANELDRSSNRLSFAIIIAAIIVGSSIVLGTPEELHVLGISVHTLGLVGYVVAAVLGLGLSWAIYRSGRLH
jgi:ubiquinone biosynthesis protein